MKDIGLKASNFPSEWDFSPLFTKGSKDKVTLITSDAKKLYSSKLVIALNSNLIFELINSTCNSEDVTLILPDHESDLMDLLLKLLSVGECNTSNKTFDNLNNLCTALGMSHIRQDTIETSPL